MTSPLYHLPHPTWMHIQGLKLADWVIEDPLDRLTRRALIISARGLTAGAPCPCCGWRLVFNDDALDSAGGYCKCACHLSLERERPSLPLLTDDIIPIIAQDLHAHR